MRLTSDHAALAVMLPDEPRFVETRALLLAGTGALTLNAARDGALLVDPGFPSGFVIGRADRALLRDGLAEPPADFELVVQLDALDEARAALPGWSVAIVIVHARERPWPAAGDAGDEHVVVSEPPHAALLAGMPEDVVRYASVAHAAAVRLHDGAAVAVCAAGDVTETLWDVGIDTLDGHRRAGYAEACFRALAAHMAAAGRQPVWASEDDNVASLALAAKLGFVAVDGLAVLSRGGT